MKLHRVLIRKRCLWWPTWVGWTCIVFAFLVPAVLWCLHGEPFLSLTRKVPAETLVVEGWIGKEGVRAAAEEYKIGKYTRIVATGPKIEGGWVAVGQSVADLAEELLLNSGIPGEQIIVARAMNTTRNRTYEAAVSTRRELSKKNINPEAINVFTLGMHARRSRLVFSKVFGRETTVGVISWRPQDEKGIHWTRSTERIEDMVTETLSLFLRFLNFN